MFVVCGCLSLESVLACGWESRALQPLAGGGQSVPASRQTPPASWRPGGLRHSCQEDSDTLAQLEVKERLEVRLTLLERVQSILGLGILLVLVAFVIFHQTILYVLRMYIRDVPLLGHILGLVDISSKIIVSFLFQTVFFLDTPNPLKLVGAGLVLSSVIFIGGRALWQHGKWNKK